MMRGLVSRTRLLAIRPAGRRPAVRAAQLRSAPHRSAPHRAAQLRRLCTGYARLQRARHPCHLLASATVDPESADRPDPGQPHSRGLVNQHDGHRVRRHVTGCADIADLGPRSPTQPLGRPAPPRNAPRSVCDRSQSARHNGAARQASARSVTGLGGLLPYATQLPTAALNAASQPVRDRAGPAGAGLVRSSAASALRVTSPAPAEVTIASPSSSSCWRLSRP